MISVQLYSRYNAFQEYINRAVLNEKLQLLQFSSGENIFEFGCGNGTSTKILLQYIPHTYNQFIATDVQCAMINKAKEEHLDNLKNVIFIQHDIREKKIKNEWRHHFAKVFSFLTLHWINTEMHLQTFMNINSLLRINGTAFLTLVANSPIMEAFKYLYKNSQWSSYMQPEYLFPSTFSMFKKGGRQYLEDILRKAQFKIVDISYIVIPYMFKTQDEFKSTVKAFCQFISKMPTHLQNAYWNDLWNTLDKFCDVRKTCSIKTTLLFIHATKINHVM